MLVINKPHTSSISKTSPRAFPKDNARHAPTARSALDRDGIYKYNAVYATQCT